MRQCFCFPRSTRLRQRLASTPQTCAPSSAPSAVPVAQSVIYFSRPISPHQHWQHSLLHNVHFHDSIPTLLKTISSSLTQHTLFAATDGGATVESATFGWTLRTESTDLVSCFGPVHGHHPTAFRAEAIGLLSFLTLLRLLLLTYHWLQLPHSYPLTIYIDNQALVRLLHRSVSQQHYSPSITTSSEFDVLLQIFSIIPTLPLSIQFQHIKSHQDTRQPMSSLSLPAQANCCADHLATHARTQCVTLSQSPLYPAAQCSLHVSGKTITRSHPTFLYHIAFAAKLHKHILQSRSWDYTHTIDWDFFSTFCLRNTTHLNFLIKWVHQVLPIGTVLHCRQPSASPLCPACGNLENYLHFLVCNHPTRRHLHCQLITRLRKSLSSIVTDPTLKMILVEGVNHLLCHTPPSFPSTNSLYATLIQSQTGIGWDNFLRGFLSTEWMRLHQLYLTTSDCSSPSPKDHPLIHTVSILLSEIHSIWNYHCCQRHSRECQHHDSELLQQAHRQLAELYQYRLTVLPTDRHLFKQNLRIHLQDNLSSISAWLHNHASSIRQSHQKAQQLNLSHTASLSTYFLPA